LLPGCPELFDLWFLQGGRMPLALVFGENLQGFTLDRCNPGKGLGQTAFYRHVGAEQGHLFSRVTIVIAMVKLLLLFLLHVFLKKA
jgi:hypothetical protein